MLSVVGGMIFGATGIITPLMAAGGAMAATTFGIKLGTFLVSPVGCFVEYEVKHVDRSEQA